MKRVLQVIGIVALIALLLAAALWTAVRVNGPAVLDTVDRITGGARDVERVERQIIGPHDAQKIAIYRQKGSGETLPVFLFVHGGAWRDGDPDDYSFVARGLAPEGFVVVLAGYRLGEEGRYPAMVEDTADAIAWTRSNIAKYGGDPDRLYLSGHSAGAYNVVQVALDRRWLDARGVPDDSIDGVIGFSGPYDFFPFDKASSKAAFETVGATRDSQPVAHVRADAPPMLLVQGEADTVVRPRNTRALAAGLEQVGAGVETALYPGWAHNDPLFALASPWRSRRDVIARIMKFTQATKPVSVPVQAENP